MGGKANVWAEAVCSNAHTPSRMARASMTTRCEKPMDNKQHSAEQQKCRCSTNQYVPSSTADRARGLMCGGIGYGGKAMSPHMLRVHSSGLVCVPLFTPSLCAPCVCFGDEQVNRPTPTPQPQPATCHSSDSLMLVRTVYACKKQCVSCTHTHSHAEASGALCCRRTHCFPVC